MEASGVEGDASAGFADASDFGGKEEEMGFGRLEPTGLLTPDGLVKEAEPVYRCAVVRGSLAGWSRGKADEDCLSRDAAGLAAREPLGALGVPAIVEYECLVMVC